MIIDEMTQVSTMDAIEVIQLLIWVFLFPGDILIQVIRRNSVLLGIPTGLAHPELHRS
jgi:hypothetical protein